MTSEANDMPKLHVERIGGLAGFGGARSHVRSHGEIDTASLSATDQEAVEGLFQARRKSKPSKARDSFRYRISRVTPEGVEMIEAPEEAVPTALSQCVIDELA
jgi:hypothetical protein